jgi:hypothetical protein
VPQFGTNGLTELPRIDVILPNAVNAVIPDSKLSGYLLNSDHEVGGPKCRFLRRFGYKAGDTIILRHALESHATDNQAEFRGETEYGAKWAVRGRIQTPDGRDPYVTSIWQIDHGKDEPKFITLIDLGDE